MYSVRGGELVVGMLGCGVVGLPTALPGPCFLLFQDFFCV